MSGNAGHYQSTMTSDNDPCMWCHECQMRFPLTSVHTCTTDTYVMLLLVSLWWVQRAHHGHWQIILLFFSRVKPNNQKKPKLSTGGGGGGVLIGNVQVEYSTPSGQVSIQFTNLIDLVSFLIYKMLLIRDLCCPPKRALHFMRPRAIQ